MPNTFKLVANISRLEFLPANLASLVIAICWAINPATAVLTNVAIVAVISFVILALVSLIAAQLNSVYDYQVDRTDENKKVIVRDVDSLGPGRIKRIVAVEFLISLPFISLLLWINWQPVLFLLWLAGNFLAYAYSVPPLRLKSRSWMEFLSLVLALSVLPILFVYLAVTPNLSPLFLFFFVGQSMTVYSIIIPTETRDFFVDKAMNVITLTVRLGLVRASMLALVLLSAGGVISGAAFILALSSIGKLPATIFLIAMAVADVKVLREFRKLHSLSRCYATTANENVKREIVLLSKNNPKWITMVSQAIVLMSIVLIVVKFL